MLGYESDYRLVNYKTLTVFYKEHSVFFLVFVLIIAKFISTNNK